MDRLPISSNDQLYYYQVSLYIISYSAIVSDLYSLIRGIFSLHALCMRKVHSIFNTCAGTSSEVADKMRFISFIGILLLFDAGLLVNVIIEQNLDKSHLNNSFPVIVITWDYKNATEKGILEHLIASTCQE